MLRWFGSRGFGAVAGYWVVIPKVAASCAIWEGGDNGGNHHDRPNQWWQESSVFSCFCYYIFFLFFVWLFRGGWLVGQINGFQSGSPSTPGGDHGRVAPQDLSC